MKINFEKSGGNWVYWMFLTLILHNFLIFIHPIGFLMSFVRILQENILKGTRILTVRRIIPILWCFTLVYVLILFLVFLQIILSVLWFLSSYELSKKLWQHMDFTHLSFKSRLIFSCSSFLFSWASVFFLWRFIDLFFLMLPKGEKYVLNWLCALHDLFFYALKSISNSCVNVCVCKLQNNIMSFINFIISF